VAAGHLLSAITRTRHAELVSASMPRKLSQISTCLDGTNIEAWTLKQVQGDGRSGDCCA
jgi:hypothetical protein